MRRARLLLGLAAAATLVAACGSKDDAAERRARLITPPRYVGAPPLPSPVPTVDVGTLRDRDKATKADVARLRPVLDDWAEAVRKSDMGEAIQHWVLPALVTQSSRGAVEVTDEGSLLAFHESLPCGASLRDVKPEGRYVMAEFELVDRAGRECESLGGMGYVAVVAGDPAHPDRFTEWWMVDDPREGPPGPPKRPAAPIANPAMFAGG